MKKENGFATIRMLLSVGLLLLAIYLSWKYLAPPVYKFLKANIGTASQKIDKAKEAADKAGRAIEDLGKKAQDALDKQ
ncbi:MAG: hypothetical protein WCI43_07010 [Candidatus Firestonebacteria bacterium]